MHEVTIAMNILEIAEENARKIKAAIVHEIEVDIGELSGIDCDALEFAMQHISKPDLIKNTVLRISKIPALARCAECSNEFSVSDYYTACPACGKFNLHIIQGREMKVKAIKFD